MKIYLSNHAKKKIKQRNISFALIKRVLSNISEMPGTTYVVLVTKSILKKFNADISNADSLIIIARLNRIITCFCPIDTENSLEHSRFKGRKIFIIN